MSKIINIIKELFHNRFFLLVFFFSVFIFLNWYFFGEIFPNPDIANLWFYSGIFMVLFSLLFIEPYYTSPKNVITNAIPLLLVFLSIKSSFENVVPWWTAITVLLILLVSSITAIALEDKNKSPDHKKNKIAKWLKNFVVLFGQGKVLYSAVFLYFLFTYYSTQSPYTLILLVIWFFILAIDPKKIKSTFAIDNKELDENALGEIFGVQSRKIFLIKLFEDRKSIKKFDVVKFRYSMQDSTDFLMSGIVFDTYLLNQEKWAKVLQLGKIAKNSSGYEKNIIYKVSDKDEVSTLEKELNTNNFVGIVIEGSNIGKIKFKYSKKLDDLEEGDLIELKTNNKRLFYQVIKAVTEKEILEHRNETGFIEGEAVQLGEWQNDKLSFQKFGWVPSINTPLFKADTSDITVSDFAYPQYKLGIIPGTSLPSVIDLSEAVSHHTALLGVTGSGKSFLTQKIIEELLLDTKVICIDFTGEWKKKLDVSKYQIISKDDVETYLASIDKKVGLFELPALSNTTDVLKETQSFFEKLFNYGSSAESVG